MGGGATCDGAGGPDSTEVGGASGTTGGGGAADPCGEPCWGGAVAEAGPPVTGRSTAGADADEEVERTGAAVDASCGFHSVERAARDTVGASSAPWPVRLAGPE
ncbi:hypothetical protein Van01_48240 [Micromonospora andamanensis]|uniref:Uncharacterized protein n=1 Tax=Micromonospora andamanensis TaxID=1287068 RepID=A0ABQ4I154_9ACTN|nr:hypothetical protein Van01_48240 [Micromonospora andamanensis]